MAARIGLRRTEHTYSRYEVWIEGDKHPLSMQSPDAGAPTVIETPGGRVLGCSPYRAGQSLIILTGDNGTELIFEGRAHKQLTFVSPRKDKVLGYELVDAVPA